MIKKTLAKALALTMAILMIACTAAYAATEVVVCIQSDADPAANTGFEEISGSWFGSSNSTLNIHYVNPNTQQSLARYASTESGAEAEVTANLLEAGTYTVYYFVSGHDQDCPALHVTINHKDGEEEVTLNLSDPTKKGFQELGEFEFDAGPAVVNLKADANGNLLRFSAIKFVNEDGDGGVIINGGGTGTTPSTAPSTSPSTTPSTAPSSAPTNEEGTTLITCLTSEAGGAANVGFEEVSGAWHGSTNSELNIHYVNPNTGATIGRYSDNESAAEAIVTTNIPEAGTYKVYYFVSGHQTDANGDAAEMTAVVNHKGGSDEVTLALNDPKTKGFQELGEFEFEAGEATIELSVEAGQGFMRFSAVQYVNEEGTMGTIINGAGGATQPTPSPTPTPTPTPTPKPTPTPTPKPTATPTPKPVNFTDITAEYDWAKEAIETLAAQGVVDGVSETEFNPSAPITRAEFTKLAVSLTDTATADYEGGLNDVAAEEWYAPYIQAALDAGLIDDAMIQDGNFLPDQAITREEMTSIIVKTYEAITGDAAPAGDPAKFVDNGEISDWAKDYVGSAVAMEIIQGVGDDRFAPAENADRAQATVMIHRLMEKTK